MSLVGLRFNSHFETTSLTGRGVGYILHLLSIRVEFWGNGQSSPLPLFSDRETVPLAVAW